MKFVGGMPMILQSKSFFFKSSLHFLGVVNITASTWVESL